MGSRYLDALRSVDVLDDVPALAEQRLGKLWSRHDQRRYRDGGQYVPYVGVEQRSEPVRRFAGCAQQAFGLPKPPLRPFVAAPTEQPGDNDGPSLRFDPRHHLFDRTVVESEVALVFTESSRCAHQDER